MSDSAADREFVQRHRALVERIVASVQAQLGHTGAREDLMSCAMVGLLEARERFDPERGVLFTTFAYYRVRGAVIDGISRFAPVPRHTVRAARAASVIDAESELIAETASQQTPTAQPASAIHSIDVVLSRAATAYTLAVLAPPPETPEEEVAQRESLDAVALAAAALPERERKVVIEHYVEGRSLEDIGKDLGLSKSWMSRLHTRALDLMRARLSAESPEPPP